MAKTDVVARYIGFLKARPCGAHQGCSPSTLLLSARHLKFYLPFISTPEACEQCPTMSLSEVNSLRQWYSGLAARFKQEQLMDRDGRRHQSDVPLAIIWKHVDAKWTKLVRRYEVSTIGSIAPLKAPKTTRQLSLILVGLSVQRRGKVFTKPLAHQVLLAGAAVLVSGVYMTPLRQVSVRTLHKFNKLGRKCAHEHCRYTPRSVCCTMPSSLPATWGPTS